MRKKFIILLQIIITIVLIGTSVYAAVNATLDLKVSASTVKKGNELTVTLSLKDAESNQKVRSISGYINYNHSIIEELTVDNIVKSVDNTVEIGNETLSVEDLTNRSIDDMPDTSAYLGFNGAPTSNNDIKIVIDFNNGVSQDVDLFTMKFKVKSDATLGEIENAIEYKMFVITAGTSNKSKEISKNIALTITDVDVNTDGDCDNDNDKNITTGTNTDNNNDNNGDNDDSKEVGNNKSNNKKNTVNNSNNTTNSIKNNTTNVKNNANKVIISSSNTKNIIKDNTISSVILPATGVKAIIIPAIIFIICAYIFYNRYMKYKGI